VPRLVDVFVPLSYQFHEPSCIIYTRPK